jgi:3-oxoacyl-[acyl-carrier-protein] synthase II
MGPYLQAHSTETQAASAYRANRRKTMQVVITGLGAISAVGNSAPEMWQAIATGHSGVGPITRFDASEHATQFAAEVKDFSPSSYMNSREERRLDPFVHYAAAAAGEAIADAELEAYTDLDRERVGVLIGSGIGGIGTISDQVANLNAKGPRGISPFFIPAAIINMAGAWVATKWGFLGANFSLASACATGNHSIGEAAAMIRRDDADVVICGGAEAPIVPVGIGGFNALRALSTRNDDPVGACRPFDRDRNGFVMGEGAGVLVLESREHAQKRGAHIYAELAGYGASADAYHSVAPDPEGRGAALAMTQALASAGVQPQEVDYINAHGTGTELNDPIETTAIKQALGDAAFGTAISSTKPLTGHLLGAASALEAVITVLAMQHDLMPPTINLTTPDPDCDLDYVPLTARSAPIRIAMSNGFGFGGHNASVLFRKL